MKFRMTSSVTIQEKNLPGKPPNKVEQGEEAITSAVSLKKDILFRPRVPPMLQSTLKQKAKTSVAGSRKIEDGAKSLNFRTRLKGSISKAEQILKNITICQICDGDMPSRNKNKLKHLFLANCQHKYKFCQSCLHHYVIYKVNNFQEVNCPHEGCQKTLDMKGVFYKNLPQDIQNKYKKIHEFHLIASDPYSKLCPGKGCQGTIRLKGRPMEESLVCYTCKKEFCSKCLLPIHSGDCDLQELMFFEKNLHYRQCKNCKMVIEKNQGCNHMKCKCGYDFCYVCGAQWTPAHYRDHGIKFVADQLEDQFSIFAPCLCCVTGGCISGRPDPNRENIEAESQENVTRDSCLKCLVKWPLLVFYSIVMALIFVSLVLPALVGIFIGTIIYGIIYHPIVYICDQRDNDLQGCYMTFLLPYVMAKGIFYGFRDFFSVNISSLWAKYTRIFQNGVDLVNEI